MEITLQGSLKFFKLSDVLTFINISRKSGTLNLVSGSSETYIYFDGGEVVFAAANQERFRLSSILIRRKKINNLDWQKIESKLRQEGEKFGQIALREKLLSEQELIDFLKIQVSEIIYDAFLWEEGKFFFLDVLDLPVHAVTISIDLANLILEGARRIEEWEQCLKLLPNKNIVMRVVANPDIQEKITLTLDEWRILFLVNGKRTLEEICMESRDDSLKVYRILYGLYANKLLEIISQEEAARQSIAAGDSTKADTNVADEDFDEEKTDDTGLLVSPEATLSHKDVMKVTLARLTLHSVEGESKSFPLIEQEYLLGRQSDAQIQIVDPSVSNAHARIYRGPEGYVLEDLNSRNGTYVNGQRISRKLLQENDTVRVGNSNLTYTIVYEVKPLPAALTQNNT